MATTGERFISLPDKSIKQVTDMAKRRRVTDGSAIKSRNSSGIKVCNIEAGLPTVQEAQRRIQAEIETAKYGKWTCLKLIHGYGSSGRGGQIKNSLPGFLNSQMRKGNITDYIRGEDFSIFDSITQRAMLRYPELANDSDMNKCNHGITIVLL